MAERTRYTVDTDGNYRAYHDSEAWEFLRREGETRILKKDLPKDCRFVAEYDRYDV